VRVGFDFMNIPGGLFITLEGIDGCGKTTQAELLADYLTGKGFGVVRTREPGGTDIGRRIRAILLDPESKGITGLAELLLYCADRAQHMAEVIEPALSAGSVVVCDRFTDATAAYQGFARGLGLEVIDNLAEIATRGRRPDITLLFDLPVDKALGRARGRNDKNNTGHEARFEEESSAFHEKVRQGYLEIARREPGRVKVIAAAGSMEEIQAAVRAAVDGAIK
jgi:dTMP kinase